MHSGSMLPYKVTLSLLSIWLRYGFCALTFAFLQLYMAVKMSLKKSTILDNTL